MRITFVNRSAGIFWGGGETFDMEVARAFIRLGHDVQFVIGRRLWRVDLPMTEFPTTYVRTLLFPRLGDRVAASQSLLMKRIGWRVEFSNAKCLSEWLSRASLRTVLQGIQIFSS